MCIRDSSRRVRYSELCLAVSAPHDEEVGAVVLLCQRVRRQEVTVADVERTRKIIARSRSRNATRNRSTAAVGGGGAKVRIDLHADALAGDGVITGRGSRRIG